MRQHTRRFALLLTIVLWGVRPGVSQATSPPENQAVAAIIEAYGNGDYALAENRILEFLQEFPDSPDRDDLLYLLGRSYFRQSKYAKARETFLRLVTEGHEKSTSRTKGFFWLAESSAQLDRWDEAKAYYLEFTRESPESPFLEKSLFALGVISFQDEALAEAETYLSEVVTRFPNGQYRSQAQYYRGLIHSRWNNYHRAVQFLREALFSPPGVAEPQRKNALFHLAENRLKLDQYLLALPYYQGFYETYPDDRRAAAALYRAGWCELKTGQREAALRSFRELADRFPKSTPYPHALYRIGEIELELGDYKSARDAFNRVIKEFPESSLVAPALVNLGWTYLNLGNLDEMTRVAHRLIKLPAGPREKTLAQLLLGEAHFQRGEYKEALPYFFNLLNSPSQRENALYRISRCYFAQGGYKDAMTNIEILLLEYPGTENRRESLYLRGQAAYHLGQTEKAVESYSEILSGENSDSWTVAAMYELGKIYYERKDLSRAKDLFTRVVRTLPEGSTAVLASYFLGIISEKENDVLDALLYFHDALNATNRSIQAECHYRIGEIYFRKRSYDLSLHHFRTIVETLTDQRAWVELALFQIGNVRFAQGDSVEAKKVFQKVLEVSKDPDLREASEKMLAALKD